MQNNGLKKLYLVFLLIMIAFSTGCERERPTEALDDGLPPEPPRNLRIYASYDGEVGIEWSRNVEPDISGYNIYKCINDTVDFKQIDFTPSNYYRETGLYYDSLYAYKATAVDEQERESGFSDIVKTRPRNYYRPYSPRNLIINARNWDDSLMIYLNWQSYLDTDIKGFRIYRSTKPNFVADSVSYHAFTEDNFYTDTKEPELLKDYYYKVKAEDKGGLVSESAAEANDVILNKPEMLFPPNDTSLSRFGSFKIKTASRPANYKIVIQTNKIYGVFKEVEFTSNKTDTEISVPFDSYGFTDYRTYYWRIFTYTKNPEQPNSFTEFHSFIILP